MGGAKTDTSKRIGATQERQAGELWGMGQGDWTQGTNLMQIPIDFYTAMASGDPRTMMMAAAPGVSAINKQYGQALQAVGDQGMRGAARASTLSRLLRDRAAATAGAVFTPIAQAQDKLATLAGGLKNFGANMFGGARGFLGDAGQTAQTVMQADNAKKAATMGFLGNIVGAAGSAITGGLMAGKMPTVQGVPSSYGQGALSSAMQSAMTMATPTPQVASAPYMGSTMDLSQFNPPSLGGSWSYPLYNPSSIPPRPATPNTIPNTISWGDISRP